MTRVRLFLSSQIVPRSGRPHVACSSFSVMVDSTSLLTSHWWSTVCAYPRSFSITSPHFAGLARGKKTDSTSPSMFPWDASLRLQGVVTAFKHRRGYGFVLAEGYTQTSTKLLEEKQNSMGEGSSDKEDFRPGNEKKRSEHLAQESSSKPKSNDFFFTRAALGGGFFVREGDRVSFRVKPLAERDVEPKHVRHCYISRGGGLITSGERGDLEESDGRESASRKETHNFTAIGIRHYNAETGKESRVLPVSINGVVTQWSSSTGTGVISELDVDGKLHVDDAPKFEVRLENLDMSPIPDCADSFLAVGRYVKFCTSVPSSSVELRTPDASSLDKQSTESATHSNKVEKDEKSSSPSCPALPQAYRVIIDIGAERRNGVILKRPCETTVGSTGRQRSSSSSVGTLSNQRGVIREIVERKYAFVVDDASGESIFFHFSEMVEPLSANNLPRIGDSVMYDTELIPYGRHAGKMHCVRVRLLREENVLSGLNADLHQPDRQISPTPSPSSASFSSSPARKKKSKTKASSESPKSLLEEFDLLD